MSIGYIVFYLILIIGVDLTLGKKATLSFASLVLLSVIVVNSDKITSFLNSFTGKVGNFNLGNYSSPDGKGGGFSSGGGAGGGGGSAGGF